MPSSHNSQVPQQFYLRKAKIKDTRTIHAMLLESSRQGLLLPRSFNDLYSHLREFYVVASYEEDEVLGFCALSITWEDLAEIRSLIVAPSLQKKGWGRRLVEACLSEAVTLGLYRVFTLTYQTDFFSRMGFEITSKDVLPQKVWADCLRCPKFPECDETAMLIDL